MIRTYVRGTDLSLVGEVRGWTRLECNLRYREVGSWSVTGPAQGHILKLDVPGRGLIVVDDRGVPLLSDNGVLISGDTEDDGPRTWSADSTTDSEPGTLQVTGGDDLAIVADELAFPDPTSAVADQGATTYDGRSGAAEGVIKGYVGANVGVGRDADRGDASVPDARLVAIATDLGRGSSVSYQARFDPLMDIVRTLGQASTPELGPRVTQDGSDLVFDVYAPVDRSASVVFSRRRRNLRGYSVSRSAPTCTHVVVAGSGEGTSRAFAERADTAAAQEWHRIIRKLVDQRQTSTTSELNAAGDEELARGRRTGVLQATAVDLPDMRFGVHFGLGDLVTVEIEPSVTYVDRVTAVQIVVSDKGPEPTKVTIGNPDLDPTTPDIFARVDRMLQQISELQRRR